MKIRVVHRPFDVAAARFELDVFEAMYGVASEERDKPFWQGGRFIETDDWRRWDHLYTAWKRAAGLLESEEGQ